MSKSLEDIKKISMCSTYKDYDIYIYCGGSGDDLHWGYYRILSDETGGLYHQKLSQYQVWDVDDVYIQACKDIDYYEKLINWISSPEITYEELRAWRNICEHMNYWRWSSSVELTRECNLGIYSRLVEREGFDRRQILWNKYKIQLIKWDGTHWKLKSNWEFKIWFLEQIVLFNKNPSELPKFWLEDCREAYTKKLLTQIDYDLYRVSDFLDFLKMDFVLIEDNQRNIEYLRNLVKQAKKSIAKYSEECLE